MNKKLLLLVFLLLPTSFATAEVNSEQLGRTLLREHYTISTNGYGPRGHAGIDYRALKPLPVYAPVAGTVAASDEGNGHFAIEMSDGTFFIFLHLSEIYITDGSVAEGDMIGLTGDTEYNNFSITGPHLHVEVRDRGENPADPNLASSYASNVNPVDVVDEPERIKFSYTLAPLVTAADVRFNGDGNLVFNVDISSYSKTADLEYSLSIYDRSDLRVYQGVFGEESPEVSVTPTGGGYVTIPADDDSLLQQNIISIDGATNSVSSNIGELTARIFVRNKTVCSVFNIDGDACSYTSAFIANIGGDNLGLANSLRINDQRRIYINPSVVY